MNPHQKDITVSIVNWNTRDELRECLDDIFSQVGVSIEVIVVDNASSDGSTEMVRTEFADRVTLITNTANLGFGAGHNAAMGYASGRYVLFLNPDCRIPDANTLAAMTDYLDQNPDIGMMGPKLTNPDGSLQFSARRFPTMLAAVFRHTIFGKLFPKNRFVRDYMMTDWAHDQVTDVDWLSGSVLMVRREVLEQIGVFDERFFMYCEDVDLCKRAHQAGWRVVYNPMAHVVHRIGASSDQNPIPMIKQHHRSMLRYFLKHYSRSPRILLTPLAVVALWLRSWSLIRRAKPK